MSVCYRRNCPWAIPGFCQPDQQNKNEIGGNFHLYFEKGDYQDV